MSVYFVGDYDVQKNTPITLIVRLTKTIQSPPSYFFQTLTLTLSSHASQLLPHVHVF